MAKTHPKKIGKNAPCPCGSGRVYKRCCMTGDVQEPAEAREPLSFARPTQDSVNEARVRLLHALKDTFRLPDRLGWTDFDFGVDLFDPVVDDLLPFVQAGPASIDTTGAMRLALRMVTGLERHATLEVRARVAGVLEDYLAKHPPSRVRELLRAAVAGLEDPSIRPALIGCLHTVYDDYMLRRARERLALEAQELEASQAQLAQYEKLREGGDAPGIREWLGTLGDGALPWILRLWEDPKGHELVPGLLGLVCQSPSMRAAALLARFALDPAGAGHESEILEGLRKMPREAWPILHFRARDRQTSPDARLRAYSFLVQGGESEILDQLLDELSGTGRWEEQLPGASLPAVAALMARLGDRRAVGQVVRLMTEDQLSEGARAAVREAFQENGWWTEVEESLAAHRRGVLVLVPKGMELMDVIREKMDSESAESLEALQFRTNILNEEWNRAYHEDLEGLRPCDLAVHGPVEAALMREFADAAKTELARLGEEGELRREDLQELTGVLEYHWMRTPNPTCGGKIPLAAIWEERRELTPNRAYYNHERERLLSDMALWARRRLEGGNQGAARKELLAVLAIEPEYPFAKRLLALCPAP